MDFESYFSKQDELWKEIQRLDDICKESNKIIGRYIISSWADRTAVYVVVDETDSKYQIRFACGEEKNPYWGYEVLKNKIEVEDLISGRDMLKKIFS